MNKVHRIRKLIDKILTTVLIIWQVIYIVTSFYGYFNNIQISTKELWRHICIDKMLILMLLIPVITCDLAKKEKNDESNSK